jgi:hypothetical protein
MALEKISEGVYGVRTVSSVVTKEIISKEQAACETLLGLKDAEVKLIEKILHISRFRYAIDRYHKTLSDKTIEIATADSVKP